jgi:hypothetical protein
MAPLSSPHPDVGQTGAANAATDIGGDENDGITVRARVPASGIKALLDFLAGGKTARVETKQFGALGSHGLASVLGYL